MENNKKNTGLQMLTFKTMDEFKQINLPEDIDSALIVIGDEAENFLKKLC